MANVKRDQEFRERINAWARKGYLTDAQMEHAMEAGLYTRRETFLGTTKAEPTGIGPSFQFTYSTMTWFILEEPEPEPKYDWSADYVSLVEEFLQKKIGFGDLKTATEVVRMLYL